MTFTGGVADAGIVDVAVYGVVDCREGAADLGWGGWLVGFEERPEDPLVEFGVEHRDS